MIALLDNTVMSNFALVKPRSCFVRRLATNWRRLSKLSTSSSPVFGEAGYFPSDGEIKQDLLWSSH